MYLNLYYNSSNLVLSVCVLYNQGVCNDHHHIGWFDQSGDDPDPYCVLRVHSGIVTPHLSF